MCFVRGGGFVSALVPRSLRGNGGFGRAQTEIMRRTISDGGGGVISRQSSPDLSSAPRSKRIKGKCIPKKKKRRMATLPVLRHALLLPLLDIDAGIRVSAGIVGRRRRRALDRMVLAFEARFRVARARASQRHLVALSNPRTATVPVTTATAAAAATIVRVSLHAAPVPPDACRARIGRGYRIGHEYDVRGQRATAGARAPRVARRVEGERVEIEHEARTCKRLDGEEPRKGNRRDS